MLTGFRRYFPFYSPRYYEFLVLRATVMSTYIVLAKETGAKPEYLAQFVER